MRDGCASRTALGAAIHRANHQRMEGGFLLRDPLAERIVAGEADQNALLEDDDTDRRGLRLFIAARSRFSEDKVAKAFAERGVRQVVVLGAGLDTFAYRHPLGSELRVFEVDHPATQAWKRARLDAAEIAIPPNMAFVPVDFETQRLRPQLEAQGFDPALPAFFMILGVIGYLSLAAIDELLAMLSAFSGCELTWDYSEPPEGLGPEQQRLHAALVARTAAVGEFYDTLFAPDRMATMLHQAGFDVAEDLDVYDLLARYIGDVAVAPARAAAGGRGGAHVLHAIHHRV